MARCNHINPLNLVETPTLFERGMFFSSTNDRRRKLEIPTRSRFCTEHPDGLAVFPRFEDFSCPDWRADHLNSRLGDWSSRLVTLASLLRGVCR